MSGLHPQVVTEVGKKNKWIGPKLWHGRTTAGTSCDCPCRSPLFSTPWQPLQDSVYHVGRAVVGKLPRSHTEVSKLISQAGNCTVRKPYLSKMRVPDTKVLDCGSVQCETWRKSSSCHSYQVYLLKYGPWATTGLSSSQC